MTRTQFKQFKIPIIVIVASCFGAAGRQNTFSVTLLAGKNNSEASKTWVYSYDERGNIVISSTLKFYYDSNGIPFILDYNGTIYFYVTNLQGDVIGLATSEGMGGYYRYDAWGQIVTMDAASTPYYNALNANPLRYRGYIYDSETGFYYLQSRYYDPAVCRFINADGLIASIGSVNGNNLYSYCFNNPVNLIDQSGNWPEWVEITSKVIVSVAVVVTTVLVVTGTGGTGAVLALGVSCSSLNGGYFNEKNEGSFTSGAIGGAVSGLIQGFAGFRFNVPGIIFGGSIGSGTGTFVTEFLDKYYGMKNEKNISQILDDAGQSAVISLFTSSLTALIGQGVKMQLNEGSNELMKNFTKTFGDLINSFFSAIDDAITYILP